MEDNRGRPRVGQDVRIAFQGGGARLAAILAAVEVIDELRSAGKLVPVILSGTSAGAVGAVLTAATNGNAKDLIKNIRETITPREVTRALPPLVRYSRLKKLDAARKIMLGKSLTDSRHLRKLLLKIFSYLEIDANTTFNALPVPVKVIAADVRHKEKKVYSGDDRIIDALIFSMSLPGVFSMPREPGDHGIVDGGILSNLPVDELQMPDELQEELIPRIAISFKADADDDHARSTLRYGGQILSAIIDEKVKASIEKIGDENVCKVKTPLTLFDSDKFMDHLLGAHHKEAKDSVYLFFESWFDRIEENQNKQAINLEYSASRTLEKINKELLSYFDSQSSHFKEISIDTMQMTVVGHSLEDAGAPRDDIVENLISLSNPKYPLTCIKMKLLSANDIRSRVSKISWSVSNGNGDPISSYSFPIYSDDGKLSEHIVIFGAPLGSKESGPPPYQIVYRQRVTNFFAHLIKDGWDLYCHYLASYDSVSHLECRFYFPEIIELGFRAIMDRDEFVDLSEIESSQLPSELQFRSGELIEDDGDMPGFRRYTWVVTDLKRFETLVVKYDVTRWS